MPGPTNLRFRSLWEKVLRERPPRAKGAAGELMAVLESALGADVVEYMDSGLAALFLVDLSMLGFKGMDLNVVVMNHPTDDDESSSQIAALLRDYKTAVQSVGFCLNIVLQYEEPVRNESIPSSLEVIYLCGEDLEHLISSASPAVALFGIIRRQVSLEQLCPFNTTREARGSMFRGRKKELSKLVSDLDTSFLITGARLIGKTSLMLKACSSLRVRAEMRERAFYFDCSTWGGYFDCVNRMAHEIEPRKEQRIERGRNASYLLQRRSANGRRPLLLFFDEFDGLVDTECATGWQFLGLLHEARAKSWVRLAFAGFRSVPILCDDRESPFYGSLSRLTLNPLDLSDLDKLLRDPFAAADIQLNDAESVSRRILRSSGGHPFLVQFYGERLFSRAVERQPQEASMVDVEEIEQSRELTEFLKKHFLWNTKHRGTPVASERVCALVYAHDGGYDGWNDWDFCEASRRHGHPLSIDEISEALENLCNARVFSYRNRCYVFTFPLLKDVLMSSYPNVTAVLETM